MRAVSINVPDFVYTLPPIILHFLKDLGSLNFKNDFEWIIWPLLYVFLHHRLCSGQNPHGFRQIIIFNRHLPGPGTTDGGSYYPVSASQRMYTFFKFTPSSYFSFCRFHIYPTGIWNNNLRNIKNRPPAGAAPAPAPPRAPGRLGFCVWGWFCIIG
jgi:hypothetical protein